MNSSSLEIVQLVTPGQVPPLGQLTYAAAAISGMPLAAHHRDGLYHA